MQVTIPDDLAGEIVLSAKRRGALPADVLIQALREHFAILPLVPQYIRRGEFSNGTYSTEEDFRLAEWNMDLTLDG